LSWYRRVRQPGGAYFFTLVTHERRPLFAEERCRALLRTAIDEARKRRPFAIEAICLLPDHLHAIWKLPDGDSDYSTRWAQIKGRFSHDWLAAGDAMGESPGGGAARVGGERPPYTCGAMGESPGGGAARVGAERPPYADRTDAIYVGDPSNVGWAIGPRGQSRTSRREAPVWQRRFWEHALRDEEDYLRHVEYIHFNPVKHGLAARPMDWEWSSFRRYVREGLFEPTWGEQEPPRIRGLERE
jgi:putative transposase